MKITQNKMSRNYFPLIELLLLIQSSILILCFDAPTLVLESSNMSSITEMTSCLNCSLSQTTQRNIKMIQKQLEDQQKAITNITLETFKETQKRNRQRIKQERVDQVLEQILARTGISNPRTIKPEVQHKVTSILSLNTIPLNNNITIKPEVIAQKYFSFYASCSLPLNSERDVWFYETGNEYRLFFNLSSLSNYFNQKTVHVQNARLRFKVSSSSNNSLNCKLICKTITATLYRYNRPLKRNEQENYNLIHGKTFIENFTGLIEFNFETFIVDWIRNSSRNFGAFLKLEDEFGNSLPPKSFFSQNNCSNTNIAIPNLVELFRFNSSPNNSLNMFQNYSEQLQFPVLDIITIEK